MRAPEIDFEILSQAEFKALVKTAVRKPSLEVHPDGRRITICNSGPHGDAVYSVSI